MNTETLHLKSYFGFAKMPFTKYMWASKMFEASSQKEFLQGLNLWLETRGIALLCGPPGVGKSITLRRFKSDIDERRYDIFYLFNMRVTPLGFLRSMARLMGAPVLYRQADLFDALNAHLGQHEERSGKHPVIVFDDCDGLSDELLELLRRLANFAMDSEDRFSFILSGSQRLAATIREPQNESLRQRIAYAHNLVSFTLDDAGNYIDFHLKRAEAPAELFADNAVNAIFHRAEGLPRRINQIAIHALIRAAILRKDKIDDSFLKQQVFTGALFDPNFDEQ
jgi:type II secretory pathway predicted ATPase ExeA